MAKKINLKVEKAKRNKEYALKFKKRRPASRPRGPRYSDGPSDGGPSAPGGFAPRPRTTALFTAACSSCGQEAKLPFEPTSGKPVFCDACFQNQR
jgi:CxxC-x17-CxxC domain-containing protein